MCSYVCMSLGWKLIRCGMFILLLGKWKSFGIQNTMESNFVQVSCGLNYCCGLDNEGMLHRV